MEEKHLLLAVQGFLGDFRCFSLGLFHKSNREEKKTL